MLFRADNFCLRTKKQFLRFRADLLSCFNRFSFKFFGKQANLFGDFNNGKC
jgi:hypothetical protein